VSLEICFGIKREILVKQAKGCWCMAVNNELQLKFSTLFLPK
jgi:hypothetical protein